ncbi:DUF2061 domain-containing protein [Aliidiomarina indica]|uniref:DUF2061 domain-containing protein n=1 Tax=Aliidiomarina indica TaxID=2749147 RepID=UPI00188FCE0F|nr:DUF2061 domain-containing protein [Aliidiomarina indica]
MKKTFSFAIVHFTVAFGVTWLLTGSFILGGLVALIEPAVNSIAYFFHEKAWQRFDKKDSAAASDSLGVSV